MLCAQAHEFRQAEGLREMHKVQLIGMAAHENRPDPQGFGQFREPIS